MGSWLTVRERKLRDASAYLLGSLSLFVLLVVGAHEGLCVLLLDKPQWLRPEVLLHQPEPLLGEALVVVIAFALLLPRMVGARLHAGRKTRFPDLTLFSITLTGEVDDAKARMETIIVTLYPHLTKRALVLVLGGDGQDGEAPHFDFLLGVPSSLGRVAHQTLNSTFKGREAKVRRIKAKDSVLFAPIIAAFEAEDAERAARQAETERRVAEAKREEEERRLRAEGQLDDAPADDERADGAHFESANRDETGNASRALFDHIYAAANSTEEGGDLDD